MGVTTTIFRGPKELLNRKSNNRNLSNLPIRRSFDHTAHVEALYGTIRNEKILLKIYLERKIRIRTYNLFEIDKYKMNNEFSTYILRSASLSNFTPLGTSAPRSSTSSSGSSAPRSSISTRGTISRGASTPSPIVTTLGATAPSALLYLIKCTSAYGLLNTIKPFMINYD